MARPFSCGRVHLIPFFDRPGQLLTYSFQVGCSMREQFVLPRRHLRPQVVVGDGAGQPAGKIAPFEADLGQFVPPCDQSLLLRGLSESLDCSWLIDGRQSR